MTKFLPIFAIIAAILSFAALILFGVTYKEKVDVSPEVQYAVVVVYQEDKPEKNIDYTIPVDKKQQRCLAKAIYFEARNQSFEGKIAVAAVVLNRVKVGVHPNTICEVVHTGCQFSWNCDKTKQYDPAKHRKQEERDAWDDALELAKLSIIAYNNGDFKDVTRGATYFHANYVKPYWARWKKLERTVRIEDHVFYRVKDTYAN